MSQPMLEGGWTIRSSTSRFFTVLSEITLTPVGNGFELDVDWEKHGKVKLVDRDFSEVKQGTLRGSFNHPREPAKQFELVVTLCPEIGPDGKKYLFGLLFPRRGGVEDEGTGIWVAEAPPPLATTGG